MAVKWELSAAKRRGPKRDDVQKFVRINWHDNTVYKCYSQNEFERAKESLEAIAAVQHAFVFPYTERIKKIDDDEKGIIVVFPAGIPRIPTSDERESFIDCVLKG